MTTAGRPTVLDPTKKEVIYALIQVGASQRRAAAVVGVSEAVIRYWIRHDAEFAQRVEQAIALLEVELMVKLRESAGRSWRAAAYALEHLVPDRFSKTKPVSLIDAEQEIQRELYEMECARELDEIAVNKGNPPPPPPEPDPNEPTTVASRQFSDRLTKLLTEAQTDKHERRRCNSITGEATADALCAGLPTPHDAATDKDLLQEFLKNGPARQMTPEELLGNGHSKSPRRPR